jgi:hypothetical protein
MTMTFLFLSAGTYKTDPKEGNDKEHFTIIHFLEYKVPHLKTRAQNEFSFSIPVKDLSKFM